MTSEPISGAHAQALAKAEFHKATGIVLRGTPFTDALLVDRIDSRPYALWLCGPYHPGGNKDIRLFLWVRQLEGLVTIQVTAQDADDDAVLNANADLGGLYFHTDKYIYLDTP